MELRGARIVVMGMGRSGQAAARLARDLGARVLCTDLRTDLPRLDGVEHVYGEHREADFASADALIVSPGIPAASPLVRGARERGLTVLGELGFAYAVLRHAPLTILGITGTNGKSSVASFTGQLLEQVGRPAFVGGNIGQPLSLLAHQRVCQGRQPKGQVAVVEVSSYQMELPGDFAPNAGVILNLSPDHLHRHGDMAGYAAHKLRLFARCDPQAIAILPEHEPLLPAEGLRPEVLRLGGPPGAWVEGHEIVIEGAPQVGRLSLRGLQLYGEHNRLNMAAAVLLAVCAGAPLDQLDPATVRPLAHRLERVHEADGVVWINDSKATNVQAAVAGLSGIDRPQIVLLGGDGKEGASYAPLRVPLAKHARHVICFGRSGPTIAQALDGLPCEQATDMTQAMARARALAQPGDAVLLSPACASFDEFRDFEHRGERFTALAQGPSQRQR